ncbi:MAG: ABC transporter permease [Pseudomonadota bacterium]
MFSNYIKLALRNMAKNRLYAFINVSGLAIGLAVFLFSMILASYERDHDSNFVNRDRIFTLGSVFSEGAEIGVLETDSVYAALGGLLRTQDSELETVARTVSREFLLTLGPQNDSYYHNITFADPELTSVFDFDYLVGDDQALSDPSGVILSASLAEKFFGRIDVVGEVITLDHEHDMVVKAVIEEIPADSHFNSSLLSQEGARAFAPLSKLAAIREFNFDKDWGNLSLGDLTYVLLPGDKSKQWLQDKVDAVFAQNAPEGTREFIPEVRVRPLVDANTMIWDAIGIPAITSIQILGLLVLIVACVNYTNLATAQSIGRAREVGLRKTFGADRRQLLVQFLLESITTVAISMLLALACLELAIPAFNTWSTKAVSLAYVEIVPYLVLATLIVGSAAGAYPAYLITKAAPASALHGSPFAGTRGGLFRSIMIGLQFTISVFMLASVFVMYFQNQQLKSSADIFPRESIAVLERVGVEDISQRHATLRSQLLAVPGVEDLTYISQLPFVQSNSSMTVSPIPGDESAELSMSQIRVDDGFLSTLNIPLLAGRSLTRDIAGDYFEDGDRQINVLLNEMAVENLGFESGESAIGKSFYQILSDTAKDRGDEAAQYTVVGVIPDRNFNGLHNKIKPMAFYIDQDWLSAAAIKISSDDLSGTLTAIERVWDEVIPDYPIQQRFLDDVFNDVYVVFQTMNGVLAGFAMIALALALIGLFGLAAFMAERRTREIGIRKVLGARVDQIVRLLVWQFSVPVLWSLLFAMPLAYFSSGLYLNFFDERITFLP